MAKDRFSNQKRSNWDNKFRWGVDTFSDSKPKCAPLTEAQKASIRYTLSYNLTEWERLFCLSILNKGNKLSDKQRDVLKTITVKYCR